MRADALRDNTAWRQLVASVVRRGIERGAFSGRYDPDTIAVLAVAAADGMGIPLSLGDPAITAAGGGHASRVPPEVIEGPDEVVAGEQARFRIQSAGPHQVVSWAVGGGAVSHAPDPAHPSDLLLLADQPGDLTIIARVREGLTERRATKTVTAVAEVAEPRPPFTLRLFLHGWGLVVVAVLIVGFARGAERAGQLHLLRLHRAWPSRWPRCSAC